jgi:hypothetical protein
VAPGGRELILSLFQWFIGGRRVDGIHRGNIIRLILPTAPAAEFPAPSPGKIC